MGPRLRLGQGGLLKHVFVQGDFDRFAALTGDYNPIHVDQEFAARTPFGRTVSHGMLLYSVICKVLGTRVPGPGTVQLDQELTFFNPAFAGDELLVLAWVVEREEERATLDTIVAKQDGTLVCQGKTSVLLPGTSFPRAHHEPTESEFSENARWMSLEVGQRAAIKRIFTSQDLKDRADLVGDMNPVFLDEDYTSRTPFERPIIPGDLLGGMISQLLGMRLPGPGTSWLKQRLAFPTLARVGEEMVATVEVSRIRADKGLVNLTTTCTNSAGEVVCGGEALVLARGTPSPAN